MNRTAQAAATESQVAQRAEHAPPRGQKFLTTGRCAERFGVSRHTWMRWVKSRQAPAPAPLPGHPRWAVSDIERFERGRDAAHGRVFFGTADRHKHDGNGKAALPFAQRKAAGEAAREGGTR